MSLNFWDNWYGRRFFNQHPEYYIWYARPGYAQPDRDCYLWQYACDNGGEYGADEPLDKNILLGEYIEAKPVCAECERLKAEMALMEANHKAESEGWSATVDGYIEDMYQMEELLVQANRKVEIAAEQINSNDYFIEQLKKENGVLKETIISLQEKECDHMQPEENLLVRILEKVLSWLKGE